MLHSNAGELDQLYATFTRVWGEGGGASLSLETVDGKVNAVLKVQLGPPADLRPGAPVVQQQAAGGVNQQLGVPLELQGEGLQGDQAEFSAQRSPSRPQSRGRGWHLRLLPRPG